MSVRVVFIHGWGMSSNVWSAMTNAFPNHEMIDLGFMGDMYKADVSKDDKSVFITHSLGTAYALRHHTNQMRALVSINGFACFKRFADDTILRAIGQKLESDPLLYMQNFWRRCGLADRPEGVLHYDRLKEGLGWLRDWDEGGGLRNINVPVLSLAGARDKITPLDLMKEEWSGFNMKIAEDGGHVLPVSHTDTCVTYIKEFMDEHGW